MLCLISNATVLLSQSAEPQANAAKIVTLSFNAVVLKTTEAQKELKQLQVKFAPRQAELQSLNADIEEIRKQLNITIDKLSDSERAKREQDLNGKEKQLQRKVEDFKNDSDSESQQVFQRVAQKVYSFLENYSKQRGYSLVVERGTETAPVIWYAADTADITDQVVKAYDASAMNPKQVPPAVPPGTPKH
jgi:outer membrane protein